MVWDIKLVKTDLLIIVSNIKKIEKTEGNYKNQFWLPAIT